MVGKNYTLLNGAFERLTWFQIQVSDTYGNHLRVGGHHVDSILVSETDNPIYPTVQDNNNGTYTITYLPGEEQSGPYSLEVTLDGDDIEGSPFSVTISPKPNNAVLLGVTLGIAGLCLIILVALVAYRRWRRRGQYQAIAESR